MHTLMVDIIIYTKIFNILKTYSTHASFRSNFINDNFSGNNYSSFWIIKLYTWLPIRSVRYFPPYKAKMIIPLFVLTDIYIILPPLISLKLYSTLKQRMTCLWNFLNFKMMVVWYTFCTIIILVDYTGYTAIDNTSQYLHFNVIIITDQRITSPAIPWPIW